MTVICASYARGNKVRLFFLFVIYAACYAGQSDLGSYILKNAKELRSIRMDDTAYSDLEPLGAAIRTFSVVMLGEMWHGDGATFEAKSRIIRYLHEKHDFNVLAFESDFYSLTRGFETGKTDFDSLIKYNIFSYWSEAVQCKPLFEYIKNNPSLKLCGIDNQLKGSICKTDLKVDLSAYITSNNLKVSRTGYGEKQFWRDFDTSLSVFTGFSFKNRIPYDKNAFGRLIGAIDSMTVQLDKNNRSTDFLYQAMLSYRALCLMFVNLQDFNKASAIRDEQMSKNLEWLVSKKYPGEKIIVWLASSHMVKDNQSAYEKPGQQPSMGYYYTKNKSNPPVFALGFTSDGGKGYAIGNMSYNIPKTKSNSIEKAFKEVNRKYLFVSLTGYQGTQDQPFLFSKIDGGNNIKARWQQAVDGILYIDTMTPAEKK